MKKEKIEKYICISGYIALILLFVYLHYSLSANMDFLLDSDMSSELILSKMLSQEGKFASTNWYYSTELRVINTQLLFSLLFLFIDNWRIVRMIGIIIMNIILLLCFVFLGKELKLKYLPWLCVLVIGGTSIDYLKFVLLGSYYIPYIAASFITVGIMIKEKNNEKNILAEIVLCVLAFLQGLAGFRQIVVLYAPLFMTSLLMIVLYQFDELKQRKIDTNTQSFKYAINSFVYFCVSFVGLLVNKFYLSKIYDFSNYGTAIYITRDPFGKLIEVLKAWAFLFSYDKNAFSNLSADMVLNGIIPIILMSATLIACIYTLLKFKEFDFNEVYIIVFFLISSMIISGLFFISDIQVYNRYLMMNFIYIIPVFGILLKKNRRILPVLLVLSVLTIFNTGRYIRRSRNEDRNQDLLNIMDILKESDSVNGYAAFWNANVLTELSNGEIEVWCYTDGFDKFDPDKLYKWLQNKEHTVRKPEGRTFLIIDKGLTDIDDELEIKINDFMKHKGKVLDLFIFESNDQLRSKVKD